MAAALNKKTADFYEFQRNILCRFVFAFIFCFLLYYLYSNTMVHQLHAPALRFPYVDITYWIFHYLKIPDFVTSNYIISCCFDILLFASCILAFIFPSNRIFIVVFFLLYFIYFITFNSYGAFHAHAKIGILLIPIPFMFPGKLTFQYLWEAIRYFALFIYADAFFWKLFRLTILSKDHGILILKKNYASYIFYHPNTAFSRLCTWLLEHPAFIQFLFITGFILEGLFIIGFFTKRFDKYLFIISILIPFGFLLLSDAFFFELIILSFSFISLRELLPGDTGTK